MWWKCTTSAECKTIRIAVSTVMDDTWILLDMQEPVLLIPSLHPSLSQNPMEYVSCRGQSHWWEILHSSWNMFSSKTAFIKCIANKIGFYAKEPYSLPLEPSSRFYRSCIERVCWVLYVLMAILLLIIRVPWRWWRLWRLRWYWRVRPRGLHQLPVAEMESLHVSFIRCAFWL